MSIYARNDTPTNMHLEYLNSWTELKKTVATTLVRKGGAGNRVTWPLHGVAADILVEYNFWQTDDFIVRQQVNFSPYKYYYLVGQGSILWLPMRNEPCRVCRSICDTFTISVQESVYLCVKLLFVDS